MNKMRYARIAVAALVLVIIFACTFAHVPIGTLCSLCPVGFAEVSLASGSVPWDLLPGVLIVLVIIFLLGRVFCSWICPTSLLRNIFGGRKPRGLTGQTGVCTSCSPALQCSNKSSIEAIPEIAITDVTAEEAAESSEATGSTTNTKNADKNAADARVEKKGRLRNNLLAQGIVLATLLVVSFIVHFPVFCLFCPIGLVFGTMFAISRMFITWQPGWELIVFPVMLILELFVLRKWCSAICPLGFFFGLMAKLRSRVKALPHVHANQKTCIHDKGCDMCVITCPENICAPGSDALDLQDCTLCLDCKEHCPTRSITLWPKNDS